MGTRRQSLAVQILGLQGQVPGPQNYKLLRTQINRVIRNQRLDPRSWGFGDP